MLLLTIICFAAQVYSFEQDVPVQSTWQAFYENYNYVIEEVQDQLKQAVNSSAINSIILFEKNETVAHVKSLLFMLRPTVFGVKLQLFPAKNVSTISTFLDTPKLLLEALKKQPETKTKLASFLEDFCPMFLGSMKQLWNETYWKIASYSDTEIGPACRDVDALCKWMLPKNETEEQIPIYYMHSMDEAKFSEKVQLESLAETITVLEEIHNYNIHSSNNSVEMLIFDDVLAETVTNVMPVLLALKKSEGDSSYLYQLAKQVPKYLAAVWSSFSDPAKAMVFATKTTAAWTFVKQQCKYYKYYENDLELASAVIDFCKGFDLKEQVYDVEGHAEYDLKNDYVMVENGFKEFIDIMIQVKKNFTNTGSHELDELADNIMSKLVSGVGVMMKDYEVLRGAFTYFKPGPPNMHEFAGIYKTNIKYIHEILTSFGAVRKGILQKAQKTVQAVLSFVPLYENLKNEPTNIFWTDNDPDSLFLEDISALYFLAKTVANMVKV